MLQKLERMIVLYISTSNNVFDILALLCSFLTLEEERECAILWETASEQNVRTCLKIYKKFIDIILDISVKNVTLGNEEVEYINSVLDDLKQNHESKKEYIYLLAREVENKLELYSEWQMEEVFYVVEPLNTNYKETGVILYPHTKPRWDMSKSERKRIRNLNAVFSNYMLIRQEEAAPFEIVMYYWNDEGLLKPLDAGWYLPVAISPVTDGAKIKSQKKELPQGRIVRVDGLENEEFVNNRVLDVFDEIYKENYSIIVFPEMLGTIDVVREIKIRMRKHPECTTIVLLPTICKDGENTLIILGPNGTECLRQNKLSSFILIDDEGNRVREELVYDNKIHLVNTRELGIIAFPICADLLDPKYYHAITEVAMADTIICPSCSPGITAFTETLNKGMPLKILQIYLNTCSAKGVSRNGKVSDVVGIIQLPDKAKTVNEEIRRECGGICEVEYCYFDINIFYRGSKFTIETAYVHGKCA